MARADPRKIGVTCPGDVLGLQMWRGWRAQSTGHRCPVRMFGAVLANFKARRSAHSKAKTGEKISLVAGEGQPQIRKKKIVFEQRGLNIANLEICDTVVSCYLKNGASIAYRRAGYTQPALLRPPMNLENSHQPYLSFQHGRSIATSNVRASYTALAIERATHSAASAPMSTRSR
jgi:hypothetical protein